MGHKGNILRLSFHMENEEGGKITHACSPLQWSKLKSSVSTTTDF